MVGLFSSSLFFFFLIFPTYECHENESSPASWGTQARDTTVRGSQPNHVLMGLGTLLCGRAGTSRGGDGSGLPHPFCSPSGGNGETEARAGPTSTLGAWGSAGLPGGGGWGKGIWVG